jgi:hypothetical protein
MELFREVIPTLEQVVAIAEMRDRAFDAPKAAIRRAMKPVEHQLSDLMDQAGEQMDMIVEQTIRDTVRNGRQGKGTPPAAARGAAGAGRRGPSGKPGKRHQRAVKRSRARRAG